MQFPIDGWNQASISNGFRDNQWQPRDLKRTLKKGQGHSFWYESISHTTSYRLSNSNFCSRTHRLATIHNVTDDKQRHTTDDCSISATVSTVG